MKINIIRYILVPVPEVSGGGPTKVLQACGLDISQGLMVGLQRSEHKEYFIVYIDTFACVPLFHQCFDRTPLTSVDNEYDWHCSLLY